MADWKLPACDVVSEKSWDHKGSIPKRDRLEEPWKSVTCTGGEKTLESIARQRVSHAKG